MAALAACLGSLSALAPARARAADVRVGARTIGEGYVILAPGSDEARLLRRTRLVQYVNLGVYELLPPKEVDQWRREEDDGQLELVASMRLRQDFGEFLSGAGQASGPVLESLDGRQIDLLYGYVQGRRIGGFFDFRAGRQFETSGLDWYVFDGGWARVRTPAHLGVEVFGGLQVNPSQVFGWPTHALDGTSGQDPADTASSPMLGAAVSVLELDWIDARLAYRRTFTPAAINQGVLEPTGAADGGTQPLASGVDQELVSATMALNFGGERRASVVSPFAAVRYNIGTARLDDLSAGVSLAVSELHTIRAQYLRTIPSFDLDSVFNLFTLQPLEDVRLSYQVRASEEWTLLARGSARLFRNRETLGGEQPDARVALGWTGALTALWRRQRYALRTDAFAMGGEGGVRTGGSVDGQIRVLNERIGIDLRSYFTHYADDQALDSPRSGYGLSFQLGADFKLWDGIHLTLLAEELLSPYIRHAFRGLGNLSIDWSFRAGRRRR